MQFPFVSIAQQCKHRYTVGGQKHYETGIEFVLVTLQELQLATLMVFFRLFALCSTCVSAWVIVLSDISREIVARWETSPILKEYRELVRFSWSICHINWHSIKCIESDSF
jgi:hypothetical protein